MARVEKRPVPNHQIPVVTVSPVHGSTCQCGAAATIRYRNSYREQDACSGAECRDRIRAWVGNAPFRKNPPAAKPVLPAPKFNYGNLSRRAPPKPRPPQASPRKAG